MRVRASTLFIVVVISFLMACITGSIVCMTFYYKIQVAHHTTAKRLEHNINSGVTYMLSSLKEDFEDKIDLYGEGDDSVALKNLHWGLYSIGTVTAQSRGITLEKQFMYGYSFNKDQQVAIRLNDADRLLNVAGNTTIEGDCFLPGGTVNTNIPIDGFSYHGPSQVVNGKLNKSASAETSLNPTIVAALKALVSSSNSSGASAESQELPGDSLVRSFADSTLYIDYMDNAVNSALFIGGNIVLYSATPVTLKTQQQLQDVIIVAPSVKIPSGFRSSVQVICTDSILVEENAMLAYPSALILMKKASGVYQPYIRLKKQAKVSGVVFAYSELPKDASLNVQLDKDSFVQGQVYSRGSVCLQGTVHGELVADHLILKGNKNYLLDGVVNVSKRSSHYVGSNILPVSSHKNVIKWL